MIFLLIIPSTYLLEKEVDEEKCCALHKKY